MIIDLPIIEVRRVIPKEELSLEFKRWDPGSPEGTKVSSGHARWVYLQLDDSIISRNYKKTDWIKLQQKLAKLYYKLLDNANPKEWRKTWNNVHSVNIRNVSDALGDWSEAINPTEPISDTIKMILGIIGGSLNLLSQLKFNEQGIPLLVIGESGAILNSAKNNENVKMIYHSLIKIKNEISKIKDLGLFTVFSDIVKDVQNIISFIEQSIHDQAIAFYKYTYKNEIIN
ncbi:hypothetical protein [Mycoplasma procyoni]|uniref:hypothetical protein n=1 Tax=Mycoplasma procyoni TaxID=568784 RepID=UPI00197B3E4B|nr:hypothetical protein [Mycoplasma procyoni]MBN3535110.1 hypothetical protein [Mycoplasma procyoni]